MAESIKYLIAIVFMFILLFDFRKKRRLKPEEKNFRVSNKVLSKVAVVVIAICILLTLFVLLKTQQLAQNSH
jgi:heme/copper-type cytochrome/quinol oxidase subunit 2